MLGAPLTHHTVVAICKSAPDDGENDDGEDGDDDAGVCVEGRYNRLHLCGIWGPGRCVGCCKGKMERHASCVAPGCLIEAV
jgi:hypothetical protein